MRIARPGAAGMLVFVMAVLMRSGVASVLGDLPDASLTPGAVASHDRDGICLPGYARLVRPRGALWRRLKERAYERYGLARGHRSRVDANGKRHPAFAIDHLVPLELGGAPADLRNLWPQPVAAAHRKDAVENALHELVCAGKMPLGEAQARIARDWETALGTPHAREGGA